MNEVQLIKCINDVADKWKTHFGLHTYYVGYMTAEMMISLLTVWRYSDHSEFLNLSDKEILAKFDDKIRTLNFEKGLSLQPFPCDQDVITVMPKLRDALLEYDLSEDNVPQAEWERLLAYLESKIKR